MLSFNIIPPQHLPTCAGTYTLEFVCTSLCAFIQWVPGVKRPELEADYSTSYSAEVNNAWHYTSNPPISVHGVVLNKAMNISS